jgi:hypothetical protein
MYLVENHLNWMEFYTGASEEISKDIPPEKGLRVRMTVYIDADHVHVLEISFEINNLVLHVKGLSIRDK